MAKATAAVAVAVEEDLSNLNAAQKAWVTRRKMQNLPPKPPLVLKPIGKIVLPKEVKIKTVSADRMFVKTAVFVLTTNAIGNHRQAKGDFGENVFRVVADATTESVKKKNPFNTTKELMEAPELDEIFSLYGELRRFVETRTLPLAGLRSARLLPNEFDEEVNARVVETREKIEPLVEQLAKNLPRYKAEAKIRLSKVKVGNEIKNFYNEDDYPTAAQIRASFNISARSYKIDSAGGLSKKREKEEREKLAADWVETRDTIKLLLRTQMKEFVDHLVGRLSPNIHGEKQTFHVSSLEKFNDFLNTFNVKNLPDDDQLKVLVDKAKGIMSQTTDVELLRTNNELREYVHHGFSTIQTLLGPMIGKPVHRKIHIART